jgi:anti-sigma regulatory factor (Ser/Thr protein kinase)
VGDELTIRVPPAITYVGLIRAMASGLAARLDFTYDQIMDLHIAIDEICSRLLDTTADPTALEVAFSVEGDALSFAVEAEGTPRADRDLLNPWSQRILDAVVDRIEVTTSDGGGNRIRVAVQKATA